MTGAIDEIGAYSPPELNSGAKGGELSVKIYLCLQYDTSGTRVDVYSV